MLGDKGVKYEVVEVDLLAGEEQRQALTEVEELTGKKSFPVILIKDQVIQGYKVEEIERALAG